MTKRKVYKKHFNYNIDYSVITALHSSKLRRLRNSFIIYRTVIYYYLKVNNFTYSCSAVSKLASKLWKNESKNIKNVYKQLANEAKRSSKETGIVNCTESQSRISNTIINSPQDIATIVNDNTFSEGSRNSYTDLLANHYNQIQKLERKLSDTLKIIALMNKLIIEA
ncbi:22058_t:CDS:1 [Dentiscutata erythropus]|uniref:22058_t:CDS:1 n=1 Tax=Dentiscutata erythropus TaxID=1348616 RepID=A0A9N8WDJ7_9GLOM|nr:22058_t:CDS:1 [Dentiscutata erythropus]